MTVMIAAFNGAIWNNWHFALKATFPLLDFDLAFTELYILLHGAHPEEFRAAGGTVMI